MSRALPPAVRTGLERLIDAGPDLVGLPARARIGLVVHPASVDVGLRHAVDRFVESASWRVRRLFAPEHGVRGEAQDMEPVGETVDDETGLPVTSLYGADASSLRPEPDALTGLDAVVYDLQDVGARYYTYVYTLSYVMEAAREAGVPVVVLDRPNPLGGAIVEGPVLDPALASFVGRYPLPVRHGMTSAELARWFNDDRDIGCDLRVVAMDGWARAMDHAATGLPWVAPSPNMPTVDTARVYPGGCLVEGTNLSEGRGTTRPFELVGAPWLRASELAGSLTALGLPGVRFRGTRFRPGFHKHAGRTCGGIQVHVDDPETFRPFLTYLAILRLAHAQEPGAFDWRREPYEFETERLAIDLLLGVHGLRERILGDEPLGALEASWAAEVETFRRGARPRLLYAA